jgi:hypothetical protein
MHRRRMPHSFPNKRKPSGARETSRIRWRDQGGKLRAYADLRDLGGGRRALIPPGETWATSDPEMAERLLAQMMSNLLDGRRDKVPSGLNPDADLIRFAAHHLKAKARSGEYREQWLAISRKHLERAIAYFGSSSISLQVGRRRMDTGPAVEQNGVV